MQKISTLLRDQFQFSLAVSNLIQFIEDQGCQCSLKECYRTKEQQDIYLQLRKTKIQNSQHLKGLAIDVCIFRRGQWLTTYAELKVFGEYWQRLGADFRWGGDWNRSGQQSSFFDGIHFEFDNNWGD
jgi:D-alanyl-D-alanine dipeptidase